MIARTTLVLLLLVPALGLAACGRNAAPLKTPYEAAVEARQQAEEDGRPLPPEPEKPVEDRPFILDGLI